MKQAIEAMKRAFAALSDGRAVVPPRTHLSAARNAGISLIMPAFLNDPDSGKQALAVKVVSVFDGNPEKGLARIQAAVLVIDPATGRPLALLEGATLTAIRTAAASGAATDLLACRDARTLAILGAGVQARTHLEAMCAVRPINKVFVFCRTPAKTTAFIDECRQARFNPPGCSGDSPSAAHDSQYRDVEFIAAASAREAIEQADIICAVTTSPVSVFDDADVSPGAHINAVGSYTPAAREVPGETVLRATVVVDSRDAAWQEAGDLIQPLNAGLIDRGHIKAELGELVLGRKPGRISEREITLFKSVGVAIQDAVAAQSALENARRLKLGTDLSW